MNDSGRRTATLWVVVLLVGGAMVSVGAGVGTAVADDAAAASNEDDGDGWPMAGYNARGTGYAPDVEGPQTSLGVAWSYDADTDVEGPPAVLNGTTYLADGENLTALNATTGEVEWTEAIGTVDRATGTPAVADGTVFVTTNAGGLAAFDAATGEPAWTYTTYDERTSSPVVADGTVYFATNLGREQEVHAVNATHGKTRWVQTDGTEGTAVRTPAVSENLVYFSNVNNQGMGEVSVSERESGDYVGEWIRGGLYITPPVVSNGILTGGFRGLRNGTPGDRKTIVDDPIRGRPAVVDGPGERMIIAPTGLDQETLVAYDGDGRARWKRPVNYTFDPSDPIGQPAATDEAVYFNDEGTLKVYDRSDGTTVGTLAVGSGGSQPSVADERAYLTTGDGELVAVGESVPIITVDGATTAVEDREVTLDASASTAPGGTVTTYEWDPDGDGTYEATGPTLNRTYAHPGEYAVGVRLTSDAGTTNTTTVNVTVRERVEAAVTVNDTPVAGEAVELEASASSDAAGTGLTYEWDTDGDGNYERRGERVTMTYGDAGYQPVRLRVTNGSGLSDASATRVYVAPRDGASLLDLFLGDGRDVDVPDGELEPRWSTDDELYYPQFAIAGNGTLYVTDFRQPPEERIGPLAYDIVAVDAGTGEVDWRAAAGSELSPAATTASDRVYVGTTVGDYDDSSTNLLAVDKQTGEVEWNLSVGPGSSYARPIVDGDRVYAASSEVESRRNGRLVYAPMTTVVATTADEEDLWNRSVKGSEATVRLHDGRLYVAGDLGNVTALNATTGERVWNASVDADSVGLRVRNGTALVVSHPTFPDRSDAGTLTAFDAATGERAWNASVESLGRVQWRGERLYARAGPSVTALDTADGERVWNATVVERDGDGQIQPVVDPLDWIAVDGDGVYTFNGSGGVVALNATTGDERWRPTPTATDRPMRLFAADGQVIVDGGALVSLNATDGSVDGTYSYEQPRQLGGLLGASGGGTAFVAERYSMAALTGPEPARVVASDLTVSSTEVDAGDEVTLNATVGNQGDTATTTDVPVTVDGATVDTVSVTLAPGEHRTVERTVSLDEGGDRAVAVGGATPRTVSVARESDEGEDDGTSDDSDESSDTGGGGGGGGVGGDLPDPVTTVSVEPSGEGDGTRVEVQAAQPNETVTVDLNVADGTDDTGSDNETNGTDPDGEDAAEVTAVEVVPAESGNYDLTVNGTASVPADVPAPDTGRSEPIDYVVVDHDFEDDAVESVTFTVTVSRDRLDAMDADPEAVTVERYTNGNWTALPTDVERETVEGYVVRARSPGLSAFAVTVERPALDVGEPSLNRTAVESGESVAVSVPVTNDGEASGTAALPVTVDGEAVTTAEVTVPPGETRTATATVAVDELGEVGVSVDGTAAGTVSVAAAESTTTSTSVASTTTTAPEPTTATDGTTPTDGEPSESTDSGGQPGFGPLVALAALGVWLARRR
ncbi:outer membrane protein assembly factor BamB family protein [Halostella salina]|uniref:outer membrane protein assembly factor BamB family protein n=1 Tax=Halostella salina TaxID=1547897 RepID=UPI000EF788BA|nr:PQQ-binding-like beta-propeller repeat protein [Halostella salina]